MIPLLASLQGPEKVFVFHSSHIVVDLQVILIGLTSFCQVIEIHQLLIGMQSILSPSFWLLHSEILSMQQW